MQVMQDNEKADSVEVRARVRAVLNESDILQLRSRQMLVYTAGSTKGILHVCFGMTLKFW
jgi:hypothetical protein